MSIWIILIIVIVIGSAIFAPDALQGFVDQITGLFGGAGAGVGPGAAGTYYGNVNFIINQHDHLAGGAVTPTNGAYELFHGQPVKGLGGIAITASGTTTEVSRSDSGAVWMTLYGGDDFYIVEDCFRSSNPRVKQAYWSDYDEDGDEDYVVQLDVSDIGIIGSAQTPDCTLSLPLLDLDKTGLTDDDPSDVTGIGTSEVVKQVVWKLSGITAEDGVFMTRLYFATNSTRGGDDLRFEELSLSGGWVSSSGAQSYFGNPVKEENGNYEAWYVNPSDYLEYHQGMRLWRDTNEADSMYVSVNIRCILEAGDVLSVDIYADFVDPTGATAQVTDQVLLKQA